MTITVNQAQANEIFSNLLALHQSSDIDSLKETYQKLKSSHFELDFKFNEEVEFVGPPHDYTQLIQHCQANIGGYKVYEWSVTYFGYEGGGGAGWFVEEDENSISLEVSALLKTLGIFLDTPNVPKPE